MTLRSALDRFDRALLEVHPVGHASLAPGLGDDEIAEFNRAIAPLKLSAELEELFRWHNGCSLPVLYGKSLLAMDAILCERDFQINELQTCPAWLVLSEGPDFQFATLEIPGAEPERSVWKGDTHDAWLSRTHDSLEAMFLTLGDLASDDSVDAGLRAESLEGLRRSNFNQLRRKRSPGAFEYPNPPAGTYISRFTEPDWPQAWLRSIDTSNSELQAAGKTSPIAAFTTGLTSTGSIAGKVVRLSGNSQQSYIVVEDSSGRIDVWVDHTRTKLSPILSTWMEADLEISPSGQWIATSIRRLPG